MKFILPLLAAMILFFAAGASAETTNTLSDAGIQGRQLAQQLCNSRPDTNFTQNGTLKIRDKNGNTTFLFVLFQTRMAVIDWQAVYIARPTTNDDPSVRLAITHENGQPNRYLFFEDRSIYPQKRVGLIPEVNFQEKQIMLPFAKSDFWIADLGLEFFHWPEQKILPKITNLVRGRDYTLLESTNPNPATNGYSRVLTWIDKETGGILEAEAYDFNGKLLKEFAPKSFKKVNGQWELQEMEIRNVQTGSRTRLEFDLNKQ
jgi:hypothetical protein